MTSIVNTHSNHSTKSGLSLPAKAVAILGALSSIGKAASMNPAFIPQGLPEGLRCAISPASSNTTTRLACVSEGTGPAYVSRDKKSSGQSAYGFAGMTDDPTKSGNVHAALCQQPYFTEIDTIALREESERVLAENGLAELGISGNVILQVSVDRNDTTADVAANYADLSQFLIDNNFVDPNEMQARTAISGAASTNPDTLLKSTATVATGLSVAAAAILRGL